VFLVDDYTLGMLVNFVVGLVTWQDSGRCPFVDYFLNLDAISLGQLVHCIFCCLPFELVSSIGWPFEFGSQVGVIQR